ncbi:MAG: glycosyltransferase family 1 protein [Acidobacteriota bacterium]
MSPLHPRKLWSRAIHLANLLGWHHVRLWLSGLSPRRLASSVRWLALQGRELRRRRREPRLTVAVDIGPFWEPLTGIGWYLYRLLEHLADSEDVRLRLYGPALVDKGDQPPPVVPLPSGPAVEVVSYRVPEDFSIVYYVAGDLLRAAEDRLVALDRNEVVFAPNFLLPPRLGRCRGARVVTVHDLTVETLPETMRESTRQELASQLRTTVRGATRVLTDSEAVRGELVAAGLAEEGRVHAVPLAPGAASGGAAAADLPTDLPDRFVLHVGTLEPRKNLAMLMDVWAEMASSGSPPPLVLCGGFGWKSQPLRDRIEDAEARATAEGKPPWLRHLGYVPDDQLAALYRKALWVVMPSLYEGFGLPAVEAMAVGVPLIVSDIPVLREVAGDAALYAPPKDAASWRRLLEESLGDDPLRRRMAEASRARSARFDWARTAAETVDVWRSAAEEVRRVG